MRNLFHKIMKHTHSCSLRTLLFKRYFLSFLSLWIILEFFLYFYLYRDNYTQVISQQSTQCMSIYNSLNESIEKLDTPILNLIYSNQMHTLMTMHQRLLNAEADKDGIYQNALDCCDTIRTIKGFNQGIEQLNIYDSNFYLMGAGYFTGYTKCNARNAFWIPSVQDLNGQRFLSEIHQSEWVPNYPLKQPKISVFRVFNNLGFNSFGYVECTASCADLFSYVNSLKSSTSSIYIFNRDKKCIYPYEEQNLELIQHYASFLSDAEVKKGSYKIQSKEVKNSIITTLTPCNKELFIILVSPTSIVYKSFRNIQIIFAIIFIISCIMSFILSYSLAGRISEPLNHLSKDLKDMKFDNIASISPVLFHVNTDIEEILQTIETVNKMQTTLYNSAREQIVSKNEQVHAQMLALESQMNPHFLYNNLTNLCVMAEEGMNDKIVILCKNLSFMMRYISSVSEKGVFLLQEVEHVKCYFYCLQIRYEDEIKLILNIPEEMYKLVIPKFAIQPFIENASKYALNVSPPWIIRVDGKLTERCWKITIQDNGLGFDKKSLSDMEKAIRDYHQNPIIPNISINGMGILNVYIRMQLFYNENAIFKIENNEDRGAKITLGAYFPSSNPVK